jgi:acetoin:2,6-dichlorophenolindophenol oxidoreductase subunit alpha
MAGGPSIERYVAMLQMRHFDQACLEGVPTLEIHGELHTAIGQEGIAAGMIGHLRDHDALVSTHRNHYHAIAKGVPLRGLLAEIYEKETGICNGRGGHMHPFDPEHAFSATGIVGASLPVALGYAYAFWMRGSDNIAVAITGDGGSNHGTFHECLNIAGAWRLPFIVLVENNNIAISVPFDRVSATATVAERAGAYGAWGRKVDGTDPDFVAEAFAEAIAHARNGRGPALLEATCFRFRGHYEGDHDSYRDRKERKRIQREHDPVLKYREKLIASGVAEEAKLLQLEADSKARMQALLAEVRRDKMPDAASVLDYRFVEATS